MKKYRLKKKKINIKNKEDVYFILGSNYINPIINNKEYRLAFTKIKIIQSKDNLDTLKKKINLTNIINILK